MTPTQIRSARAALKWSADALARRANLSSNSIYRIENGGVSPSYAAMIGIERELQKAGIRFLGDTGIDLVQPVQAAAARHLRRA